MKIFFIALVSLYCLYRQNKHQETIMTTATLHTTHSLRHYVTDVSHAARAFAAALFAARERQYIATEVVAAPVSERGSVRNHMKLIRMANDYQDMQPSLAAELRQLAGRG